tara:strand:+ start:1236 stop:1847 length:612 start_codon:yes stop_codon:yes gene_type:complete
MFLWSALAHLIALTSPGPDTAIVIRQVSLHGRNEGFKASIGIGLGIYIHCLLAINGISIIILSNDLYKFVISMIGSSYIIYLGISMLLTKKPELSNLDKHKSSYKNSILIGLVTNIFNVKAFLFFISLFTILIDTIDGLYFYIYPLYFAVTSSLWFILVSYILTVSNNKNFNLYANKYISLIMSFVLCFIGLLILIRSIYEYF